MTWTILGQDKLSGKLETFIVLKDGGASKREAFREAAKTVEVLAIIQGNHSEAITLYAPFSNETHQFARTEAERIEMKEFERCSEYWEGI